FTSLDKRRSQMAGQLTLNEKNSKMWTHPPDFLVLQQTRRTQKSLEELKCRNRYLSLTLK
ncbi:MAG: hypothetical protein ACKO96_07870, partial [Flammeovirgaceae bacterium]